VRWGVREAKVEQDAPPISSVFDLEGPDRCAVALERVQQKRWALVRAQLDLEPPLAGPDALD
jgi:hypothetical protein